MHDQRRQTQTPQEEEEEEEEEEEGLSIIEKRCMKLEEDASSSIICGKTTPLLEEICLQNMIEQIFSAHEEPKFDLWNQINISYCMWCLPKIGGYYSVVEIPYMKIMYICAHPSWWRFEYDN